MRHTLRLVGDRDDVAPARPAPRTVLVAATRRIEGTALRPAAPGRGAVAKEEAARRSEVERENVSAAAMTPTDARWVMAVRVSESLDGGRAAVLTPEKRRRLVAIGTRMGLRPFESNLVIAIVQDSARTGERRLAPEMAGRLALIPAPGRVVEEADDIERGAGGGVWGTAAPIAVAVTLALLLMRGLILWVMGA